MPDDMSFLSVRPRMAASAWVAPGATLVGDVALEDDASVWFGCVLRADLAAIRIGAESNVQDLTVVHVDHDMPASVGRRVTIGHRCVIHGCIIGDGATIGMGAVLLSGCRIGKGALVAAGAVVREGFEVPDGAIAAGVPALVRGRVREDLARRFKAGVASYVGLARAHREAER
jgi:carbonic anhydrase/acetyltransferase-like protein (isoleucine patch superfamily)